MDSHLAELTVKETMDFSARAQGPGTKRGTLPTQGVLQGVLDSCVAPAALPLTWNCKLCSQ